jgi:DNA-binding NarL/FixJ family response regulator
MTPHGLIAGMTGTLATAPARHAPSDSIGVLPQEQAGKLSTREQEIVAALGSGQRVKEIAQELVISTHTVRNHLKAIYRKLNVSSQFELISMLARGTRHVEPHSIM